MTDDTASGYAGQLGLTSGNSAHNALMFAIWQVLGRTRTMTLVRVLAVTNDDELSPVGFVDVEPLVNLLDGLGNASPNGTIFNVPYTRIQGGVNAIIMDPKADDIGWMAVADRDISNVKSTKDTASPASLRRFNLADGVYMGGVLNGTPSQYVRFTDDRIELVSPTKLRLQAPVIEVVGEVDVTGNANLTGSLLVSGSGAVTGTWSVGGALSAASAILGGAFAAASAAITNLLTAGNITVAVGTIEGKHVQSRDGSLTDPVHLGTHVHGVTSVGANTTAPDA